MEDGLNALWIKLFLFSKKKRRKNLVINNKRVFSPPLHEKDANRGAPHRGWGLAGRVERT
jgi:hypothetical protein